jgi:hypothetical protein
MTFWAGTLLLVVALDLSRQHAGGLEPGSARLDRAPAG